MTVDSNLKLIEVFELDKIWNASMTNKHIGTPVIKDIKYTFMV